MLLDSLLLYQPIATFVMHERLMCSLVLMRPKYLLFQHWHSYLLRCSFGNDSSYQTDRTKLSVLTIAVIRQRVVGPTLDLPVNSKNIRTAASSALSVSFSRSETNLWILWSLVFMNFRLLWSSLSLNTSLGNGEHVLITFILFIPCLVNWFTNSHSWSL
jgi:hypothetical protein